jgi:hypothetical protein
MSIALGDLGMFDHLGTEEVPMLVETRKYNWGDTQSYGLVVHHPDFLTSQEGAANTPSSLPRVSDEGVDALLQSWKRRALGSDSNSALMTAEFVEPIHGQKIQAAFASVTVPGREKDVGETGWFIVMHPRKQAD